MRRASIFGLIFALGGAFGCAPADDVPPPAIIDTGFEGGIPPVPGVPLDAGGDLGGDLGDEDGCLADPLDARVLFVIDRSETMGELATGGDGLAFNVIASQAALQLLEPLPQTSSAGLLLFPSQSFDDPECADVDALAQQFPFRDPDMMEGLLTDLWSMESLILGKPRARAMQRAAEGVADTDLSDVLVVLFTDTALGCLSGTETDGVMSLEARGARVLHVRLGTSSVAATSTTPAIYSSVSEVLADLEPELDAVRRRCEAP
jgi:hypothetical protein